MSRPDDEPVDTGPGSDFEIEYGTFRDSDARELGERAKRRRYSDPLNPGKGYGPGSDFQLEHSGYSSSQAERLKKRAQQREAVGEQIDDAFADVTEKFPEE